MSQSEKVDILNNSEQYHEETYIKQVKRDILDGWYDEGAQLSMKVVK